LGKEDERHLWPQMLRAIKEIKPSWVVGENVHGIVNWSGGLVFEQVQTDLEAEGYEVQSYILPACAKNAPHRRDRVWFVAYSDSCNDRRTSRCNASKSKEERHEVRQSAEPSQVFGAAPNANNAGTNNFDNGINKFGQKKNEGRQEQPQPEFRPGSGAAPNARCVNKRGEEESKWTPSNFARCSCAKNPTSIQDSRTCRAVTNANNQRLQGHFQKPRKAKQPIQKKNESKYSADGRLQDWLNFPTQPPICGRDDGLPTKLDGITFPKWRNESIKGYGNAIVPDVALEIFKAIEQYELKHTNHA